MAKVTQHKPGAIDFNDIPLQKDVTTTVEQRDAPNSALPSKGGAKDMGYLTERAFGGASMTGSSLQESKKMLQTRMNDDALREQYLNASAVVKEARDTFQFQQGRVQEGETDKMTLPKKPLFEVAGAFGQAAGTAQEEVGPREELAHVLRKVKNSALTDEERNLAYKNVFDDYRAARTDEVVSVIQSHEDWRVAVEDAMQQREKFGSKTWRRWERGTGMVWGGAWFFLDTLQKFTPFERENRTPMENARMYHQVLQRPEMQAVVDNWFDKYIGGVTESGPFMIAAMAPAALTGGAALPSYISGFLVSYGVEGNSAYQTSLDRGEPEYMARMRGTIVGMVNGGIEIAGGGPAKYWQDRIVKNAMSKVSKLRRFSKHALKNALREGIIEEVPQEISMVVLGGDVPRKADGSIDGWAIVNRLFDAAAIGTIAGGMADVAVSGIQAGAALSTQKPPGKKGETGTGEEGPPPVADIVNSMKWRELQDEGRRLGLNAFQAKAKLVEDVIKAIEKERLPKEVREDPAYHKKLASAMEWKDLQAEARARGIPAFQNRTQLEDAVAEQMAKDEVPIDERVGQMPWRELQSEARKRGIPSFQDRKTLEKEILINDGVLERPYEETLAGMSFQELKEEAALRGVNPWQKRSKVVSDLLGKTPTLADLAVEVDKVFQMKDRIRLEELYEQVSAYPESRERDKVLGVILHMREFGGEKPLKKTLQEVMSPQLAEIMKQADKAYAVGDVDKIDKLFRQALELTDQESEVVSALVTLGFELKAKQAVIKLTEVYESGDMEELRRLADKYDDDFTMVLNLAHRLPQPILAELGWERSEDFEEGEDLGQGATPAIEQVFKDTIIRTQELQDMDIEEYIKLLHEHGAWAQSNIDAARKGDRGYTIGLILSAEAGKRGVEDAISLLRSEFGDPQAWTEEDFKQASEELKTWKQQDVTPELEEWVEEVGDEWLDEWMNLGALGLTEMMHLDIDMPEFFTENPHTFVGVVRKTLAALENADKSVLDDAGKVEVGDAIRSMKGIIARYNELTGDDDLGQGAVPETKPPTKPLPATPDNWDDIIKMEKAAQSQAKQATTGKKFTATLFRGFDPKEGSTDAGMHAIGTYFSDVLDIASYFGEVRVFEVTLNNPLVIGPDENIEVIAAGLGLTVDSSIKRVGDRAFTPKGRAFIENFTAKLKELGYDGIVLQGKEGKDTTTVAFDSSSYTQIAGSSIQQQWTPIPPKTRADLEFDQAYWDDQIGELWQAAEADPESEETRERLKEALDKAHEAEEALDALIANEALASMGMSLKMPQHMSDKELVQAAIDQESLINDLREEIEADPSDEDLKGILEQELSFDAAIDKEIKKRAELVGREDIWPVPKSMSDTTLAHFVRTYEELTKEIKDKLASKPNDAALQEQLDVMKERLDEVYEEIKKRAVDIENVGVSDQDWTIEDILGPQGREEGGDIEITDEELEKLAPMGMGIGPEGTVEGMEEGQVLGPRQILDLFKQYGIHDVDLMKFQKDIGTDDGLETSPEFRRKLSEFMSLDNMITLFMHMNDVVGNEGMQPVKEWKVWFAVDVVTVMYGGMKEPQTPGYAGSEEQASSDMTGALGWAYQTDINEEIDFPDDYFDRLAAMTGDEKAEEIRKIIKTHSFWALEEALKQWEDLKGGEGRKDRGPKPGGRESGFLRLPRFRRKKRTQPTETQPPPPPGSGPYAPPPTAQIKETNEALQAELEKVKRIRKDEEIPAIRHMHKTQIAKSLGIQESLVKEGIPAADVIRRSKGGYNVKADVPQYTPIQLTAEQWDAYSRQVYNVYVGPEYKFQQTAAQDALDKLSEGRVITDAEAALLIPVMGVEVAESIADTMSNMGSKYDKWWNLHRDHVLFWKMPFNFDVQFLRNARSFLGRHPIKFGEGSYKAVRSFASKDYTNTLIQATRGDPAFAEAEAYGMPFLEMGQLAPMGKLPEQFRGRLPYRMSKWGNKRVFGEEGGKSFKHGKLTRGVLRPARFIGKWQLAAERSFVASANWFMLDLWKTRQKQWDASLKVLEGTGLTEDERIRINEKVNAHKTNYASVVGNWMKIIQAKSATGRAIQTAANFVLWSPSMTWSRFRRPELMLTSSGSRAYAMGLEATNIATIYAISLGISTIANYFRDDDDQIEVELDPTSSNWGRFKQGNTWFDLGGGEIQHYRALAQAVISMVQDQTGVGAVKTQSGRRVEVPTTEIAKNYIEGRETALIGVFHEILTGENMFGQKVWQAPDLEELKEYDTTSAEIYAAAWRAIEGITPAERSFITARWISEHLMPASLQAFAEASITDGWPQAVAAGMSEAVAMSAQSYKQRASAELAVLQDELAHAYFQKDWDVLKQSEQREIRKNEPHLQDVQISIRKEKKKWAAPDYERREAEEIENRVFDSLSDAVKNELEKFGLTAGTVGRRLGAVDEPFYLNEDRYERYVELTMAHVQKDLDNLMGKLRYKVSTKANKEQKIQDTLSKAKTKAREELTKEIENE